MIHILSPDIANKIAAGEVVERPASVVRELVDNAIDAGASRIDVVLDNGGLQTIQVIDNGTGMSKDDAMLCIKRHATSKIQKAEDLESILTKGFRGEALAAIGSVSRLEIKTRRKEDELGTLIAAEGGKEEPCREVGTSLGTSVTIRNLFYNTPARQKFLKKPSTEMGHVLSIITWNALAHENIHFTFTSNGRRTLDIPAVFNRAERIQQIFGKDIIKDLIPIQFDSSVISISGFISRPTLTRNNAQQIHFFVNDRFVKDRILHTAMMNGYRNLIPSQRYPVVFLFYQIDPREIDINVHPTKQEIKFAREDAIFSATYGAIRNAWDPREEAKKETQKIFDTLEKETPQIPANSTKEPSWLQAVSPDIKPSVPAKQYPENNFSADATAQTSRIVLQPCASIPSPQDSVIQGDVAIEKKETIESTTESPLSKKTEPEIKPVSIPSNTIQSSMEALNRRPLLQEKEEGLPAKNSILPSTLQETALSGKQVDVLFQPKSFENETKLKIIGQLLYSYILAEGENGLYIVDQHAAHERLKFEEFLIQSEKTSLVCQDLLFPITLDFSPDEITVVEDSLPVFRQLGFDLESFGNRTYILRSLPAALSLEAAEEFIKDILGEIRNEGSIAAKKEKALHTLACKAAVKFGDPLSREDMESIVRGLEKIPRRNVCPHGRPAILHVSDDELRQLFKRTGF